MLYIEFCYLNTEEQEYLNRGHINLVPHFADWPDFCPSQLVSRRPLCTHSPLWTLLWSNIQTE